MKADITSWIMSVASVIGAFCALGSKIFIDPLLSVAASGVLVLAVGFTVLLGHATHNPDLYTWFGDPPGMAAETAILFLVIGSGKITMALKIRQLHKRR